jgi:hypothetical protein
LVNVDGRGDFFGGIPADCRAADDVEHDLGAADEASLAEALHYVRTGSCSTATALGTRRVSGERVRATGWQSIVNAH